MNARSSPPTARAPRCATAPRVRNRGGGSRDAAINNYRISLHNDQTWRGIRVLNLNASSRWRKSPAVQ